MRLDINYRRIDLGAVDGFIIGALLSAAACAALYGVAQGAQALKRWWNKKEVAA